MQNIGFFFFSNSTLQCCIMLQEKYFLSRIWGSICTPVHTCCWGFICCFAHGASSIVLEPQTTSVCLLLFRHSLTHHLESFSLRRSVSLPEPHILLPSTKPEESLVLSPQECNLVLSPSYLPNKKFYLNSSTFGSESQETLKTTFTFQSDTFHPVNWMSIDFLLKLQYCRVAG